MSRSATAATLTVVALAFAGCRPPAPALPEGSYRMVVRLSGVEGSTVTLQKAGAYVGFTFEDLAEAEPVGGRVVFEGPLESPELHYLQISGRESKIPVFLDGAEIEVTADPEPDAPARVVGSPAHDLWVELERLVALHDSHQQVLEEALDAAFAEGASAERVAKLKEEQRLTSEERQTAILRWVGRHSGSAVAAYAVVRHLANRMDEGDLAPVVAGFAPGLAGTRYLRDLEARLERLAGVQVGEPAPDFQSLDRERQPLRLSDLRGRWVLVDFWASWCGPCRRQNPQLLALYDRYRERGFEILGVGLEFGGEEPWRAAIETDRLTWPQVSALRGYGEEAARLYGIRALPANVLIDPDGVIAARNLRDERLAERLAELLGA